MEAVALAPLPFARLSKLTAALVISRAFFFQEAALATDHL